MKLNIIQKHLYRYMINHNYCVILAGGGGSRFWPVSREDRPKQFLGQVKFGKSLLRLTYERMSRIIPSENILVVTLDKFAGLIREEIPELSEKNLLLEPFGKHTAPSIAFASYKLLRRDPEAVMVSTPADHIIDDIHMFEQTIENALDYAADKDVLITLGIVPTKAETKFGYIQMTETEIRMGEPVKVKTFTEKPDAELADVFFKSGEFLWNSGIFIWKAEAVRKALETLAPEVTCLWKGWEQTLNTEGERKFLEKIYSDSPTLSIDYAVMEKSENVWVYPASFKWANIINWDSLREYASKPDKNGNVLDIKGNRIVKETEDTVVYSERKDKLIAVKGLKDFLVIDTDDVLMICPNDDKSFTDFNSELAMPDYEKYR